MLALFKLTFRENRDQPPLRVRTSILLLDQPHDFQKTARVPGTFGSKVKRNIHAFDSLHLAAFHGQTIYLRNMDRQHDINSKYVT